MNKKIIAVLVVLVMICSSFGTVFAAEIPESQNQPAALEEASDTLAGESGTEAEPSAETQPPTEETPAGEEPVGEAPAEEMPAGETQTPAEETPAKETPSKEAPAETPAGTDGTSSALDDVLGADGQAELLEGEEFAEELEPVNEVSDEFVTGEILVVFEDTVTSNEEAVVMEDHEAVVQNEIELENEEETVVVVEIPEHQTVAEAVEEFKDDPAVKTAQPNFIYSLPEYTMLEADAATVEPMTTVVNDPYRGSQWYLNMIGAYDAWDTSKTSSNVKVAVIDTGVDTTHPDLKGNIINPYDAVTGRAASGNFDKVGHGTHVAGIIAATANNGIGIAGVSYNAKVIPINVFQEYYYGQYGASTVDICAAYDYAMSKGARVVNLSLGGYGAPGYYDYLLEDQINAAATRGVVTVCAAGNGDDYYRPITAPMYPSDFKECVSVMPVMENKVRARWADYNNNKNISAPGAYTSDSSGGILSTYPNNQYVYMQGSSQAAPVVAGVAALLIARNPALSTEQVKNALYKTAMSGGSGTGGTWNQLYGYGIVNAKAAVQYVTGATKKYVTNISISGGSSVQAGNKLQMKASVSPSNASNKAIMWSVTSLTDKTTKLKGTASISSTGVLTAKTAGKVTVVARAADGGQAYASYTVNITPKLQASVYTSRSFDGITVTASGIYKGATIEFRAYSNISGGSDARYYSAKYYATSKYQTLVRAPYHANRYGTYTIEAYVKGTNGARTKLGRITYTLSSTGKLSPPSRILVKSVNHSTIAVYWRKVAGATGYEVYRANSKNGPFVKIKTVSSNVFNMTDKGLSSSKTYYYKVCTRGKAYGYPLRSRGSLAVYARPKVVAVKSVAAYPASSSSNKITWKAASGTQGYQIFRSTSKTGTYSRIAVVKGASTLSYVDKGLTAGKTYWYKVRTYRIVGGTTCTGEVSSTVSAAPKRI